MLVVDGYSRAIQILVFLRVLSNRMLMLEFPSIKIFDWQRTKMIDSTTRENFDGCRTYFEC